MNSYLDMYRGRIFSSGETEKDRIEYNLTKDFNHLVKKSPNRTTILYKDSSYQCILATGNSRVGTQTERKVVQYLMTDRSLKLPEGATFTTSDLDALEIQHWLVLHREIHPYYGYFKYKIIELNYFVKYIDNNGILKEIPVYINGTGEFDIKEYFRYVNNVSVELPNKALNLILPANPDFNDSTRFIIGDEAWRYVDSDKISIPGVYYATLNKTQLDKINDSIEDKIADINLLNNSVILSNYGSNNIKIGLNTKDLFFYILKNNKIKNSDMVYSNFNTEVIDYKNNKLIPIAAGETEITVTDKITNFTKVFKITIENSLTNYFSIVGDLKIPVNTKKIFDIFTDKIFTYSFDEEMIKIEEDQNNKLIITALNNIGNTTIHFFSEEEEILSFDLEICSLWV